MIVDDDDADDDDDDDYHHHGFTKNHKLATIIYYLYHPFIIPSMVTSGPISYSIIHKSAFIHTNHTCVKSQSITNTLRLTNLR